MTGHGESHVQRDGLGVTVELRTINSRFLKITTRASEGFGSLEPQIETTLRGRIRRGTLQAVVRVVREATADDYQVNVRVLDGYRRQLDALRRQWNLSGETSLESMLLLPGAVDTDLEARLDTEHSWPVVAEALEAAVENLDRMRAEEGRAMAADLRANCRAAGGWLEQIRRRAPLVIETYRNRLGDRIRKVLEEYQVTLEPGDLVREASLFAERSDISEEIVRLASHLEQFESIMELPESSGRKLEFLIQEMFREANTIGSKSYDVEIARLVIEIKTCIERLREMIQNVE
jgi:uncharacterized protein (TIGR00255 family)